MALGRELLVGCRVKSWITPPLVVSGAMRAKWYTGLSGRRLCVRRLLCALRCDVVSVRACQSSFVKMTNVKRLSSGSCFGSNRPYGRFVMHVLACWNKGKERYL